MFRIPYAADIARYTATAAAASFIAVGVAHAEKITKEDYKAVKAEAKTQLLENASGVFATAVEKQAAKLS